MLVQQFNIAASIQITLCVCVYVRTKQSKKNSAQAKVAQMLAHFQRQILIQR